jgi:hypothetical protein
VADRTPLQGGCETTLSDTTDKLTCTCLLVFLLDAVVERVVVAPDRFGGFFVTTMAPGVAGSRFNERDVGGAGPPVLRLAVCFVLAIKFSELAAKDSDKT